MGKKQVETRKQGGSCQKIQFTKKKEVELITKKSEEKEKKRCLEEETD